MKEASSAPLPQNKLPQDFTETNVTVHSHLSLKVKMDINHSTHAFKQLEFSQPDVNKARACSPLLIHNSHHSQNSHLESTKMLTSDNSLFLPHYLKHQVCDQASFCQKLHITRYIACFLVQHFWAALF